MDAAVSRVKFDREIAKLRGDALGFVTAAGWRIVKAEFPILAVVFTHPRTHRCIGFRFLCDGWDQQAPALTLFNPDTEADLTWEEWPKGGWSAHAAHPVGGRPMLCLPGLKEYHTHPSHLNDPFLNYRGRGESYTLCHIVHRVQQRFGDTNG